MFNLVESFKKNRIKIISIFSILCIVITACTIKKKVKFGQHKEIVKKNKYIISNKESEKKANTNAYINTNISSVSLEESIFLEDLELKFEKQGNLNVAVGRKFYTQNNLTTKFMSWDRRDLMGDVGICRMSMMSLMSDLEDDGKINGSSKVYCNNNKVSFTRGQMKFQEYGFSDLEDWHGDDFKDALYAFLQSCRAFKGNRPIQSKTFSVGTEADWRELCRIGVKYYNSNYPKAFFERYFTPFKITDKSGKDNSKFTGYYIWELPVSLKRTSKYWYPIYKMPPECKIDKKCLSRVAINNGGLAGRNLELAWASNPMDVYFMQVQGSGIGVLEDGRTIRFNYAGKNNMKFVPYSEYIKQHPNFCPVQGYGNTITWLNNNPKEALQATSITDSFVFFETKSGLEPVIGSQGVPLTQSRSIAIDPTYIPYGVPMWIETHLAIIDQDNHDDDKWVDWNRLYIAQDTGSAIKGIVRADLYMGHGKKGEFIAKNQNFSGSWFILIPNHLIDKVR